LIAGNETTTNLLGGMIHTYAEFPDQYDMIRANPDLIPQAIEEHVRYTIPVQNLYRYTRAPYRVGDVTIPTGSRVLMSFGAGCGWLASSFSCLTNASCDGRLS
jgi:cytochrome P450